MTKEEKLTYISIFVICLLSLVTVLNYTSNKDAMRKAVIERQRLENELEYTKYCLKNKYAENLSYSEHVMLLNIVEAEEVNGTFENKVACAEVFLNRIESNKHPDRVEAVLFYRNAVTPTIDGTYGTYSISTDTLAAVKIALDGSNTVYGSTFFLEPKNSETDCYEWFKNNLEYVCTIDDTEYYKEK